MKVMIVDDEPLARDLLRALLGELPGIEVVAEAADGLEAVALTEALRPDLVFLDIDMPTLNGVHAAGRITGLGARIVFVTAHEAHAVDAFDLGAIDYLLKPVRRPRLALAVQRAERPGQGAEREPSLPPESLWVPVTGGVVRVPLKDVTRIEAAGDHVYLHTPQRSYLYRSTMAAMQGRVAGSGLIRTHRSAFVRPERVEAVLRNGKRLVLRMDDGAQAPVGDLYRAEVLAGLAGRGLTAAVSPR